MSAFGVITQVSAPKLQPRRSRARARDVSIRDGCGRPGRSRPGTRADDCQQQPGHARRGAVHLDESAPLKTSVPAHDDIASSSPTAQRRAPAAARVASTRHPSGGRRHPVDSPEDSACRDSRRQRNSQEGQPPIDARDQSDHRHANDPGRRCTGQSARDNAAPRLRRAPRSGRADAAGDEDGDADPQRNLSKRKHDKRRRRRARQRSDTHERRADRQRSADRNRPPERATSTATTSATGAANTRS